MVGMVIRSGLGDCIATLVVLSLLLTVATLGALSMIVADQRAERELRRRIGGN